jgi:hypothetical protein
MKKITWISIHLSVFALIILMLTPGCKKKDDTTPTPNPVSVSNTTWDATIIYSATTSWHADITFNEDGTTKYDEPADPGSYLSYGTWTLTGSKIHFGIGLDPNFIFDGTISGNSMSGTFVSGTETKTWSAVKR